MSEQRQTYANHRLGFKPFYLVAGLAILGAFVMFVWIVAHERSPLAIAGMLLALGCFSLWWSVRVADIRLQNRVIRAEMRARLERVLGASRRLDIERLTLKQMIALRFASDAEMPALFEDVLAGKVVESDEIKRRVRDWQADHLRV